MCNLYKDIYYETVTTSGICGCVECVKTQVGYITEEDFKCLIDVRGEKMNEKVTFTDGTAMITITMKEYLSLQEDACFLRALEAVGVDNWEGYSIAQDYLDD